MKFNKNLSKNNQQLLLKASNKWKNYNKTNTNDGVLREEEQQSNFIITTWIEFAKNSSIHTIHYLTSESVHVIGKFFWFCIIVIALLGMVYCCILLSERFKSNLTATVFESTNFKVTEIPFAQITLCNNNHLNYNKTQEAVAKFVGNHTQQQKELFVNFTHILENMQYGSYDEFEPVLSQGYDGFLDNISVTEVFEFMMHDCKDFLVECRWHGKPINCCDIFSRQVTEYGICWSFNSYSSAGTPFVNRSKNFPWRVANKGKGSALSVLMNLHVETKVPRDNGYDMPGALAIVGHPLSHPQTGIFIAAKSITALVINPIAFSASDDVSRLDPADRQCYYNVSSCFFYIQFLVPFFNTNILAFKML